MLPLAGVDRLGVEIPLDMCAIDIFPASKRIIADGVELVNVIAGNPLQRQCEVIDLLVGEVVNIEPD